MNQQAVAGNIRPDQTECSWCHPIARGKAVSKSCSIAVSQQFVMHLLEHIRMQSFDLIAHLVVDTAFTFQCTISMSAKTMFEESLPLRKRMISAGGDLRDDCIAKLKADKVPVFADGHRRSKSIASNNFGFEGFDQFRVQRSAINVENEVGHIRSRKRDAHRQVLFWISLG